MSLIHTPCSSLQHVRSLLSLLCPHRSFPGDGFPFSCSRSYRLVTIPQITHCSNSVTPRLVAISHQSPIVVTAVPGLEITLQPTIGELDSYGLIHVWRLSGERTGPVSRLKLKLYSYRRSVGQFVLVSCPFGSGDQMLHFFEWQLLFCFFM
jgi:hypothetical protein